MKNTLLLVLLIISYSIQAQWIQKGGDIAGGLSNNLLGYTINMPNTNTIAIGATGANNNRGYVRVYSFNGNSWQLKGLYIHGESIGDEAGTSISMPDTNTIAIGAPSNDGNGSRSGHVRVYTWSGGTWWQKGTDIDGENSLDYSGSSVSMPDPNTLAIGAPSNDGNGGGSGHVRIYSWKSGVWQQKGIDIDGETAGDGSGYSVSMPDDNTVAIGARSNNDNGNNSGHVRIFKWNGNSWQQKGNDIDGENAQDYSGYSVSMPDTNTIAIGAPLNDGNGNSAGHVRIYRWNGSIWQQKGSDLDGENAQDFSGSSISMPDSNTIAIGARRNDGNGNNSGHVRIYSWNGSSWQQRGIDIDGANYGDNSGYSVSMPNSNVVASGAPHFDGGVYNSSGHGRIFSLCSIPIDTNVITACNSFVWTNGITYSSSNNTAMDTLTNMAGCDSIVILDLTILNSSYSTDIQSACNSFTWINGITYSASNNTAMHTLINTVGCDSIVSLDLTILNSTGVDIHHTCDSLTWINGITYSASNNTAMDTLTNMAGCDSIVTLDLTILNSAGIDTRHACDSFIWINGITYSASNNTAKDTLTNMAGCDSIVTLDLTVFSSSLETDTQFVCDSFTWINGITYTSSNIAIDTLTNTVGCDSIITLDLTILNSTTAIDTNIACNSFTWINGITYMTSNNTATDTLTNTVGCDSIITLDLTILNSTGIDTQHACDSFTWINGITYTASNNTAIDTLTNAAGCDSIVTLNLTILNSTGVDTRHACDSFTWINGITYTTNNNTAIDTLTNMAGCDSLVTLNLTIDSVSDLSTTVNGITITANNTNASNYQWLDCNNGYGELLNDTNRAFTAITNGLYAVEIIENNCIDTSNCIPIMSVDLDNSDLKTHESIVSPNPTKGKSTIQFQSLKNETSISIYNTEGKLVQNYQVDNISKTTLNISDQPKGIYLINIIADGERQSFKLIKN